MYGMKEYIAMLVKFFVTSTIHFLRDSRGRRMKIKALGGKPLA